jgi:hypothetical protein
MKGINYEEYYTETIVLVKKGIKLKTVEEEIIHPFGGNLFKFKVRQCPHGYYEPGGIPFVSEGETEKCPKKCFKVTKKTTFPKWYKKC